MKILIYILPILFYSCTKGQGVLGVEKKTISIVVFAGDSNGMGAGANVSALPAQKGVQSNMKILNPSTLLFETLNIGVNNNLGGGMTDSFNTHGLELGLGNETDSGYLQPTTYLTKIAHSGYTISILLNAWWATQLVRLDTAITLVTALNSGSVPQLYFFFSEGTNDVSTSVPKATWKAGVITYITQMRARYGRVVFLMQYVILAGINDALAIQYNTGLDELATELRDFYVLPIAGAGSSGVHFNYSGLKVLGYEFTNIVNANYQIE